ncbi:MAG TPA: DUF2294 domain-containing protein [Solirubrobacteraceae bacterium]|nr:DUF2294 domain-containing protein [Solirubrobacteraceae bacterium]
MTEQPSKGPADDLGGDMLSRISTEMVRAQKKYFGKGPTSAKSYMLDDFLLIVMRENRTAAERTMVDFGRDDLVREFRQEFENEMTAKLEGMIEELTGRKILGYQSQILVKPDVVIEIFFFDRDAEEQEREATARGQLEDPSIGEAREGSRHDDMTQDEIAGS